MAPKRVLHVVGRMDRAGAETMLMNLYRHIDRSQIQFDFVTFTDEEGDYDAEIVELGGKIIPILANNPIKRMLKLRQFLVQHSEYQIVHAHMLLSNAFHLLAAKGAGVKNRISHSHNTSNSQASFAKKLYEQWASITNRKVATYKIACGELAAKYLFGTKENVWLLSNAVDVRKIIEVADKSRNYISQKFDDNGLKIIQVGRLNEVKNHNFSLEIAEELKNREVEFTLYIIGQGPLEDKLKQQVKDKILVDNIKFLGIRTDITELMASADYMIMPSLHEGFPVVLVESQATGLNAIVSDQVSSEVDLGLGLVDFLSLESVDIWVDYLLKSRKIKPIEQQVSNALKRHGFDAATNAQELTQKYLSL
ncbi:Glycosyl transferase family 1 domain-containing protein [Psychrobacter okhotskensis]|uniref:glycosyltransferase family 1 protein n=1 Tax=Psychrobacter okhotskensis TaxID=212403 RepID=UPI003F5631C7